MKSFRWFLVPVLAGALILPASAQTNAPARKDKTPQASPVQEIPSARPQAAPPRGGARFDARAQQLAQELGLDDQQRAKYDELTAKYKELANQQSDRNEEVRALMTAMRQAREAGDEARVAELQQKLRQPPRGGDEMFVQFLDEVEPLLRPDQAEKLSKLKDRRTTRGATNLEDRLSGMVVELRDKLHLDPNQQTRFDELAAELRKHGEQQKEKFAEVRPLLEQIKEAQQKGDLARAEELRKQMQAAFGGDRAATYEKFLNDVAAILRDDQKPLLEPYRQRLDTMTRDRVVERNARTAGDTGNVRSVLQAARKVRLTDEQKQPFKEIEQNAMKGARELRSNDRAGHVALAEKTKNDIKALLTEEQNKQFETALSRAGRGGKSDRPAGAAGEKQSEAEVEPAESAPEKP